VLGQLSPDRGLGADQDDLAAQLARRQHRAAHRLLRSMIPAGRV
jgi:hypothetical protein